MTWSLLGRWSLVVSRWSLANNKPSPLPFGCSFEHPRRYRRLRKLSGRDGACPVSLCGGGRGEPGLYENFSYRGPLEGRTTIFSTVVFSGKSRASTTVRATVSADIILRLGAFGHSACQIAVSVAPGIRAITRMPFGLNSSRKVLVNPRAPCFDAL